MQDPMEMASAWEHLEGRQARADGWVIEVEDGVPKKKTTRHQPDCRPDNQ